MQAFKGFPAGDELLRISDVQELGRDDRDRLGTLFYHVGAAALDDKKQAADLLARGLGLKRGGIPDLEPPPVTRKLSDWLRDPDRRFYRHPQAAGAYLLAVSEAFLADTIIDGFTRAVIGTIFREAAFAGSKQAAAKRMAKDLGLEGLDKEREGARWRAAVQAARNGLTADEISQLFEIGRNAITPQVVREQKELRKLLSHTAGTVPRRIDELQEIAKAILNEDIYRVDPDSLRYVGKCPKCGMFLVEHARAHRPSIYACPIHPEEVSKPRYFSAHIAGYLSELERDRENEEHDGARNRMTRRLKGVVPISALKNAMKASLRAHLAVTKGGIDRHIDKALEYAQNEGLITLEDGEASVGKGYRTLHRRSPRP